MNGFTTEFDPLIREAAARYMPMFGDWRWWKAQLIQESGLDPNARSGAGAEGLPQLMPDTRDLLYRQLRFPPGATSFEPQYAVPAGAYYMGKMWRTWWAPRSDDDRRRLAQASYNAGPGRLIAAQRKAGNASDYARIIAALPAITGPKNAAETAGYIIHIERYYAQLIAQDGVGAGDA